MSKQINQYTKSRNRTDLTNSDLLDVDSSDDNGTTYESAKLPIGELKQNIADGFTFYRTDGLFPISNNNRTVDFNTGKLKFQGGGDVELRGTGLSNYGFSVQNLTNVERARLGTDDALDTGEISLSNSAGEYFSASNGFVGVGGGLQTNVPKSLAVIGDQVISTNGLLGGLTLNEYSGNLPNALTFTQGGNTTTIGATKFQIGVSNGSGQFLGGTLQGDAVIESNQKIFISAGGNNSTLVLDNVTQNVGMGIPTPSQKLHIEAGNALIKSSGSDVSLLIQDNLSQDRAVVNYDSGLDTGEISLKNTAGEFFSASDGEVSSKDGYWIDNDLVLHQPFANTNTAVGSNALSSAISSTNNTSIGYNSLLNCTSNFNTSTGVQSYQSLLTGEYHVGFGFNSGTNITGGTGTISIGGNSGASTLGAYNTSIAIGRESKFTESYQLVIGSSSSVINNAYFGRGVSSVVANLFAFNMNVTGVNDGIVNGSAASSNFVINGAKGTGTGAGGDLVFQTAPAGASGSTQNALVEMFRIKDTGVINTTNMPTSSVGLVSGDWYRDGNNIKIV